MNGISVAAQRGITQTGRTVWNNNKKDGTTEAEKRMKPKDQKEEAETAKKETGKKITIQKRPCVRERIRLQSNQRFEEKQKRGKEERRDRR